ncbi:4Fe-4S binding protein [Alteromonadaceae bacterium 2753L.S.0a.02]|nr:4Fe-4S binding protein [Alteromonadaceae bacterium 2753L.S.0a.02]
MAVEIVDLCVSCWACVDVCPSEAISKKGSHMLVNAKKCTECEGDFADPQCASICPIESCILDATGAAINPPGSLTGIPPELLAEAMNEIQAR